MLSPFIRASLCGTLIASCSALGHDQVAASEIVINEIHYDPSNKTVPAEFIELHNQGAESVRLLNWQFVGGVDFRFPDVVLDSGAYLVIAQDPATALAEFGVSALGPWVGKLSNSGDLVLLRDAAGAKVDRVDYRVGFPWPTAAHGEGPSMELLHPEIDNDLGGSWRSATAGVPSPGARNSAFTLLAPPQVRQVAHVPTQPTAGEEVTVTAKISDPQGVASVTLSYQPVRAGGYIRLTDARFQSAWNDLVMRDDGTAGDAVAGDDRYTVIVPASVQIHRRLVRYRITATDGGGSSVQTPLGDDPQPNFAYFCYDGVPAWRAAARPGVTAVETFDSAVLEAIPVYHLIADGGDVSKCQFNSGYRNTRFRGTLVYDGIVYDHVEFSVRGEGSTYRTGKNKWRFRFLRGHDFEARDNFGKKFATPWKDMKVNSGSAPWNYVNRGMAGIDECITYRLFELAGVPSSRTSYFHFRVIDGPRESNPNDQYDGDLWGLYFSVEVPSGGFLEDRGLPDGNLYKLESGIQQDNQGVEDPLGPADFNAIRGALNSSQREVWWQENTDVRSYGRYKAVAEAVTHYDQRDGRQGYYYHNPERDMWVMMPWDCDTMFQLTEKYYTWDRFRICLDPKYRRNLIDARNQQREVLDLMFNAKALDTVLAEFVDLVNPSGQALTLADMDLFAWDYNPRTPGQFKGSYNVLTGSSNPANRWYTRTLISADHEGQMDYLRKFMQPGGFGYDKLVAEAADSAIPNTPSISYTGTPGFPVDGLSFQTSAYRDPNGNDVLAMQWRIGEISDPAAARFDPSKVPPYEVDAVWQSEILSDFDENIAVPTNVVPAGATFRARVRYQDSTKRWSHWSAPLEFTTTLPDITAYLDGLVISEIMYHPAGDGDLEYVEIMNIGPAPLDLSPVRFTKGIDFDFAGSDHTSIASGARVLVVKNRAVFEAAYGDALPVAGEYQFSTSASLSNGGERLKLSFGAGAAIRDFDYLDKAPWPESPDGGGTSLVLVDPKGNPDHALPINWRSSTLAAGNPGTSDATAPFSGDADLDADHDGISAFMEHAFGTSDSSPDSQVNYSLAVGMFDDGAGTSRDYLSITYERNLAADDVIFEVQVSADLAAWSLLGTSYVSAIHNGDGTETVTYRSTTSLDSAAHEFIRLLVRAR